MSHPLSFIPGPAKISPVVYQDIETAIAEGVLELSHRSPAFLEIAKESLQNLRTYLAIPDDYHILYTESASSAWHSMIANAVREKSVHIVQGAFSGKATTAARKLNKRAVEYHCEIPKEALQLPTAIDTDVELVTICLNESSNGTLWSTSQLQDLRALAPNALIGVDVTSCAGAVALDFAFGDIWYFSVQKAFGLPAGLGVVILSPRALTRAKELTDTGENLAGLANWNDLIANQENGRGPTPYTPNMLSIYLLARQAARLEAAGGIAAVEQATREKAARIYAYLEEHSALKPFITHASDRSPTAITVTGTPETIAGAHQRARERNTVLGQGYGELKKETLRIANFPSITDEDVASLLAWL